jgi:hypothetical protein
MNSNKLRVKYSKRNNSHKRFFSISGIDGYRMKLVDKLLCAIGGHHYSRFERRGKPSCIHCSLPRRRYNTSGERISDNNGLQH